MSEFTDARGWCEHVAGIDYVTTKALDFEVGAKGSGLWLQVPGGFTFDVSSPWLLWWWINPHDPKYQKAAAPHDYALHVLKWDRVTAAALFSDALRSTGAGRWERFVLVVAVIWKNWR